MINTDSLEIFKQNVYYPTDIGMISNNAYLSIVVTNKCQCRCTYCINGETDHRLELPIDKAISNIRLLVEKYKIKEAILLGGEPTLHKNLFKLLKKLRTETGLQTIRLTTNGIKLNNNPDFIKKLVDKDYGIHGLNISFHNEDFISYSELRDICFDIKYYNPNIKIRINSNIWKDNLDTITSLCSFIDKINFVDEFRISNIIPKDSFSVNSKNNNEFIGLSVEEYNRLFQEICDYYSDTFTLIDNPKTLGFVRYVLIPSKIPIIINWNTSSSVSEQVCENNINTREINTFKCLVTGDISLSWNTNNIIN
ncbi:MAG: radical SAM protein [Paraclostridium sp.]